MGWADSGAQVRAEADGSQCPRCAHLRRAGLIRIFSRILHKAEEEGTERNGPTVKKLYYSIGEVSQMTDVPPHVLRYWESEFPQLHPKKGRSGNRMYQPRDLEMVKRIRELLYDRRFTIAGARTELRHTRVADGVENTGSDLFTEMSRGLKEVLEILDRKSGRGAAR